MEEEMESARRRRPEERDCAVLLTVGASMPPGVGGLLLARRRPRRSIDSLRWVWTVSRAWMWMGTECERVSAWGGIVLNWRPRVFLYVVAKYDCCK